MTKVITSTFPLFRVLRDQRKKIYAIGIPLLIVTASLVYYFSYYLRFINLVDEGFLLNGALRVLEGQVPLADFWSYPPGRYYVLAGLFHIFGVNVATERIMWIMLMTARNVLLYTVSRRLLPPLLSLLVVFSIMLIPGLWHKTLYSLLTFIHIFVVVKYVEKPNVHRAMLIGMVAGLALYFRQDYAIFTVVVNFVAIICVHGFMTPCADSTDMSGARRGYLLRSSKHIKSMLLAAVLSIVPLILLYSFQDDLTVVIRRIGPSPVSVVSMVDNMFDFPSLIKLKKHFIRWPLILNEWSARSWFPYFVLFTLTGSCFITISFIVRWLRGKAIDTKQLIFLIVVLVWTGLSSNKFFRQPTFFVFLVAAQISWILAVFLWYISFVKVKNVSSQKKRQHIAQFFLLKWLWRWALLMALSIVIGFSWYFMLHYGSRCDKGGSISIAKASVVHFKVARAQLLLSPQEAKDLQDIMGEIISRTSKNDAMFAYRQAMFYFLAERRNATELDSVVPPAMVDQEAAILVETFRDNPPKLQVMDVSEGWLAKVISEYTCDAQDALFNNYQVATTRGDYVVLHFNQGSNAWKVVQEEFAKRKLKLKLTRALDCQP